MTRWCTEEDPHPACGTPLTFAKPKRRGGRSLLLPIGEGLESKIGDTPLHNSMSEAIAIRYRVARQRGTIDETSREKEPWSITALLVNVGCWSGIRELIGQRSTLTSSLVATF